MVRKMVNEQDVTGLKEGPRAKVGKCKQFNKKET